MNKQKACILSIFYKKWRAIMLGIKEKGKQQWERFKQAPLDSAGSIASIVMALVLILGISADLKNVVSGLVGIRKDVNTLSVNIALDAGRLERKGSLWRQVYASGIKEALRYGYLTLYKEGIYVTADEWKGEKSLIPVNRTNQIDDVLSQIATKGKASGDIVYDTVDKLGGTAWLSDIKVPHETLAPDSVRIGIVTGYVNEKVFIPKF